MRKKKRKERRRERKIKKTGRRENDIFSQPILQPQFFMFSF